MKRPWVVAVVAVVCSSWCGAQLDHIVIPAGTPEDQALTAISNDQDAQKKLALYQDFLQKFSANPAAVAYGNWQISQYYQGTGDLKSALEYGDKALAGSPRNMDILVSQANIAQQMKDGDKLMEYALRGGAAFNSIAQQKKPENVSDQDFATNIEEEKKAAQNSYEYLESSAFNLIAEQADAKKRMAEIERYTPAFPSSRFEDQVASYAMLSLGELKDMARLVSYGEKALASNPNSMPTLLLLANAYVEDTKPGSLAKAITYSQKTIEVAKADAPDADRGRKVSAGVAHYTIGYANLKQDKAAAAVPELKTSAALLKGLDDQQYAITLFRLGFAYGKLNKVAEAREALGEAVKIPGPVQKPAQDLLNTVNGARAKAK
jgi:tetratricopeptide (TPR) repeat protein